MSKIVLLWAAMMMAVWTPAFVWAQAQTPTQTPAQTQTQTQAAAAGQDQASGEQSDSVEAPADDQDSNLPDIDSQPIQAGTGGPGRFIPSEQISQDSGVSFPVDI